MRSTTGDEDKFAPILGTECIVNIVVGKTTDHGVITDDSTLTIYDLIAVHDNDIRGTLYKNQDYTKIIYQGFVVVEDNSQPFLDPPFVLSIRLLDGLGLLKQVDMVDANGDLFAGNYSIQDWIGNILYKTGQTLNLRIYFPFYPIGANSLLPSLQQVYLNARTWQTGEITTTTDPGVDVFASEANDAYTALESICKAFKARIFQEDGVWNFVSLYTYVDPNGYAYNETTGTLTSGVYQMNAVTSVKGLNYDCFIGNDGNMLPVKNDAVLYLKLATKWVKLNYTYDQSVNKVCNQNFKQGAHNASFDGTLSSTIEDPTILPVVTFTTKGYDLFCWTLAGGTHAGTGGGGGGGGNSGDVPYPETAQTADIYIRDVLDITGASENRYAVIKTAAIANHARSSTFLIDANDVLQVSFDYRTRVNINNSFGTYITQMYILLHGDDGTYWGLGDTAVSGDNRWIQLDSNYNQLFGVGSYPPQVYTYYDNSIGANTAEWTSVNVDKRANGALNKVPVSGTAFIILPGLPTSFTAHSTDAQECWWKNIQITILPYLAGSYTELKGDYNFLSSSNTIKQTQTQDVNISDSPKRYFKGALIQSNGDLWVPQWHRLGILEDKRFTELMGQVVYSNINRILQKIEGTFRGLVYVTAALESKQAGFLNSYFFTDHPTPTKRFILTSFDKDLGTAHGRHVFVEIQNDLNDPGFYSPDDYVFNYLTQ